MVKKAKKHRTFHADKHNAKTRDNSKEKVNPFDLHVNRVKHDVLGKRRNYEKGGQPLKSRARGIEKRKRTLLKELNSVFKKNTFIDHRLGENDPTLTTEEKYMQRLIAERTKTRPGKESRYNLNDEEDLTHYGQSLSLSDELNQKPILDDYDDDDQLNNKGRLNSEHFFGGFNSSNEQRKPLSKQEWIENMIKTTKLDKYERQRENEKVYDMTQTLDEQWKALSAIMGIKEKKSKGTTDKNDDYDKLVNSLKFEAKTTGAPVKTIEEKEKEAAERLKALQVEEAERMEQPKLKSILSTNRPQTHISVEELDESYYIMDGSKKRVTFDDELVNALDDPVPPIEDDETVKDENQTDEDNEEEEFKNDNDFESDFDEIPSSIDKLQDRLKQDKNSLNVIWKRIHDKRLPAIPKIVLTNYFDVLLDYYETIIPNQVLLNQTGKYLIQLLQIVNNEQTKMSIINRLKQYQTNLYQQIENNKCCQIDTSFIFYLKLLAYLYPTSDFRHPITTPALTILVQAINHASLHSLSSCRQVLLLIELVKQWIIKSNRYVPEMVVLLIKLFQLACPIDKCRYFISQTSKQITDTQLLLIKNKMNSLKFDELNFFHNDTLDDNNDEHRAFILHACLKHLNDILNLYQTFSAIIEIIQPFKTLLVIVNETTKSNDISIKCQHILKFIDEIETKSLDERRYLEQGKEQTKMLKLFEPRFGPVYEGKKNTRLSKEHSERLRLRQKYKREFKATKRALILDNDFIAREELKQQMTKDAHRKHKVKEIQAQLSTQEGEYRKLQKMK